MHLCSTQVHPHTATRIRLPVHLTKTSAKTCWIALVQTDISLHLLIACPYMQACALSSAHTRAHLPYPSCLDKMHTAGPHPGRVLTASARTCMCRHTQAQRNICSLGPHVHAFTWKRTASKQYAQPLEAAALDSHAPSRTRSIRVPAQPPKPAFHPPTRSHTQAHYTQTHRILTRNAHVLGTQTSAHSACSARTQACALTRPHARTYTATCAWGQALASPGHGSQSLLLAPASQSCPRAALALHGPELQQPRVLSMDGGRRLTCSRGCSVRGGRREY